MFLIFISHFLFEVNRVPSGCMYHMPIGSFILFLLGVIMLRHFMVAPESAIASVMCCLLWVSMSILHILKYELN